MPDMTIVWKDAVPYQAAYGQQAATAKGAEQVGFDSSAQSRQFDIRPVYDGNIVSSLQGAVPYVSTRLVETADEVEVVEDVVAVAVPKRSVGRPKKEV